MKSFSYVFVATIIARFSSLISFPITARILEVAEMGELTIWHSVRGVILLAVLAGMPDIVAREAGQHKSQRAFAESLKLSYAMLALFAVGIGSLVQIAPDVVGIPHPALLLLAVAIDIVPGLFLGSLAAIGAIRSYVVCIVVPAVTAASLSALLVSPPFSLGLSGPLYAHVIASGVNALICLWLWKRHQEPADAPRQSFTALLRQSLPVLGVSIVGMSIATVDRYSIRWLLGATAVGFYVVSYQVASLLSFGGGAVRTSILSKLMANVDNARTVNDYFRRYLVCGAAFAVVLAALAPEVVRILAGEKYQAQVQLVPALCAAILALELYSFGQLLSVGRRNPKQAFYCLAGGGAVAVVLVPSLCQMIGVQGVAVGLFAGYAIAAAALVAPHVSLSARSWLCFGLVALALLLLAVQYRNPQDLWTSWSLLVRYVLAAIGIGCGLASLRTLGKA